MSPLEGVAAGFALGCAVPHAEAGLGLALALCALLFASAIQARLRGLEPFWLARWPAAAVALALSLPLGGGWMALRVPRPGVADVSRYAPIRLARIQGVVASDPALEGECWRFQVKAEQLDFPIRRSVTGRVATVLDAPRGPSDPPHFGERIALEGRLDRPGPARNPGEMDFGAYYARHGIFATFSARRCEILGEAVPWWHPVRVAAYLKARSVDILGAGLPRSSKALMGSLLFGAGAVPVDETTRQDFADLGLAHALAASGMQTTLLVRMIVWAASALAIPPLWRAAGAGLAIAFFAAMCGFAPSIMRATWMAGVALLAAASGRRATARRTLALSSLTMLIADPRLVYDMAFQFSVVATWGLVHTGSALRSRLGGMSRGPMPRSSAAMDPRGKCALARATAGIARLGRAFSLEILCSSIAAFIWCLPLQLTLFGQFSLWTLPANWFADGLIIALTDIGFVVATLGLLWIPLAWPGRWIIGPSVALLRGGMHLMHVLPGASLHVRPLPPWAALCLYAVMIPTLRGARRQSRAAGRSATTSPIGPDRNTEASAAPGRQSPPDFRLMALVIGSTFVLALAYWPEAPQLEVLFLDVGQGDAIALRSPQGRCALIDAGPAGRGYDAGQAIVAPALWRMGCSRLSLAIVSEPHLDHLGGMASVLADLPADRVWDAGQPFAGAAYQRFLSGVLVSGTPLYEVHAGQTALWDGVHIAVLAPILPMARRARPDPDDDSMVVSLVYGRVRILLPGDAERLEEAQLLATERAELAADVLKVPHHGSRLATTPAFLAAVRPRASIISVGARNVFGQPDPGTVRRLSRWGPVYRTDRDGGVRLRTDGRTWTLVSTAELAAR